MVRAKVTKANGDDLDQDEKVGIVNNFLHSLFKQVDGFLKGKQVTQATGTYAYRAYLEMLLNYGPAAKRSQLTATMFYKDTSTKMDTPLTQHSLETMLMSTLASRKGTSLAKKAVSSKWRDLYSATCL